MGMEIASNNYHSFLDTVRKEEQQVRNKKKKEDVKASDKTNAISKKNETKLSSKAQNFLNKLRKQYGDYDFFVGNSKDDLKSLAKSGSREFTVIFSNEELERMADDEKYANEKIKSMNNAVKMSEEINKKFGFESAFSKDKGEITRMGMIFNEDGTTTLFAELEKSGAKQSERMEKFLEEKRTGKKEIQNYSKSNADTKRTTIWADSMEELMQKLETFDWDAVKSENVPESGGRYDFSI